MPSSSSFSFFGSVPWFPPWLCGGFSGLSNALVFAPFCSARLLGVGTSLGSSGGCLPGLPHLCFSVLPFPAWKPRASWTSRSTLPKRMEHFPFSVEQVEERWLGCVSTARGLQCMLWTLGARELGSEDLAPQSQVANVDAFLEPR